MNHALIAINDRAKCQGEGCAFKQSCGRFLRPEGEMQNWASYYALPGDDCDYFEVVETETSL